jgi:hypothetical protein
VDSVTWGEAALVAAFGFGAGAGLGVAVVLARLVSRWLRIDDS